MILAPGIVHHEPPSPFGNLRDWRNFLLGLQPVTPLGRSLGDWTKSFRATGGRGRRTVAADLSWFGDGSWLASALQEFVGQTPTTGGASSETRFGHR